MATSRIRQAAWMLLPLGAAELGVRLLSPRDPILQPTEISASEYFEAEEIRRGAAFARPQLALALLKEALRLGVLSAMTLRARTATAHPEGRNPFRRRAIRADRGNGAVARAGALGATRLLGALTAVGLPVSIVQRRRAMAAGLDTQSWGGWWGDLAKASAIGGTLTAGAGASVTALISRYPRGWWALAGLGSVGLGGVMGTLAPVLLDPLFNDFTPLPEGEMRTAVLELARAAGVTVGEVYSVDASRRTTAANAYVAGLGPTKRVVLFDTLLDRYTGEEVRVVVAHELAHVRHRDVVRAVGFSGLVAPAAALAVQRLTGAVAPAPSGRRARRPQVQSDALAALALSASMVTGLLGVVSGRLSRAIERRCDAESLELSNAPGAFISFQRAIALQNLADVEPPRWVRALLSSHPPTLERIGAAVAYRDRRAEPG